jgi:hypothetical protein
MSLRNHEGYLLLDHRNSPGVPDSVAVAMGLPAGAGKQIFEAPTYTCKHCQRVVVMNPDRQRERAFCRGCNHRICDPCAAIKSQTLVCKTFDQLADEILTKEFHDGR